MTLTQRIVTIGSHSALQILKGAKDEGFDTIVVCEKGRDKPYRMFPVADQIIEIDSFKNFLKLEKDLQKQNAIVIPHGSFVEYLGPKNIAKMKLPHYGNKEVLAWESDRTMQREWLRKAAVPVPKIFATPEEIDRPVIVKFHGARGGRGYFLARNAAEFYTKMKHHPDEKDYVMQEYVIGVPVYVHYFQSALTGDIEIMSVDKRYESNADSIGRVAAGDQITVDIATSYTIVGNIPIVLRESLLPNIIEMGERVVKVSKKIISPQGLYGPFCLEGVVTSDLEYIVFEISARIVAGTNPFIQGSPYSQLRYDEPMSTGRRIAREIRLALQSNKLEKILG